MSFTDSDPLTQFRAALEGREIIPPQPIQADGRLHRCDAQGKHGKGDACYILHLDGRPAGGFQNWRDGVGWQDWKAETNQTFTAEEQATYKKRQASIKRQREADEEQRQTEARAKAARIWETATPVADHPYLRTKQVPPYGLRAYKGALVIPARNTVSGSLQSLQFIAADGEKKFLTGGRKKGCFHIIGTPGDTICIAEGYSTAASIHEATHYAVAVAFDCGNLKEVAKTIRDAYPRSQIIICADDDAHQPGNPGVTQATAAARAIHGLIATPEFGRERPAGATDFNDLANHRGLNIVRNIIAGAEDPDADQLEIIELDHVIPVAVRWLWPNRFALGKLSLIAGYPGLGKSQLSASIAATVTTGSVWPVTGEAVGDPGDVLILSAEDDAADTIKPRLLASGADLKRCVMLGAIRATKDQQNRSKRRCFNFNDDLELLERALRRRPQTRLIIVDPLSAYMGDGRSVDTHKTSDVRSVLAPLAELATTYKVAVIGIFHLNKREGSSAMDRINGSGAFVAAARACWLVAKDKDESRHRVFVQIKNNLAPEQDGLKFEIEGVDIPAAGGSIPTSRLLWLPDRVTKTADEVLSGTEKSDGKGVLDEVMDFISDLLAAGPMPAREVFAAADEAGYAEKTVYRAKEKLNISAVKRKGKGGGWIWSLPKEDGQDGQDGQDTAKSNLTIFQQQND